MKVTVDIDLTPAEARAFFGLPDVKPMQDAALKRMEDQMNKTIDTLGPEALMNTFFPQGLQGFEELQKIFWNMATGGGNSSKGESSKSGKSKS